MGRPYIIDVSEVRRHEVDAIRPLNTQEIARYLSMDRRTIQKLYRTKKSFRKICIRLSPKGEIRCYPAKLEQWLAVETEKQLIKR